MGDSNRDVKNTVNLKDEDPPPNLSSGVREFEEKEVSVTFFNGLPVFSFHSFDVSDKNIEKYLEKLRLLNCNVSLDWVRLNFSQTDPFAFPLSRHYLEEIGVKNIDNLQIDVQTDGEITRCHELISFIKDFHVKNVWIERGLPEDVHRSLLQSNLGSFSYNGQIQGESLLQVDSPIPELQCENMQMSSDEFSEISLNMSDSNVDVENTANLKDEDPPPILSSGVREAFHLFASMLDIHSFMNLAMTSEEMYEQCMENRRIKLNLEEKEVSMTFFDGLPVFSFLSFDFSDRNIEKYLEKLRHLRCNVSLEWVRLRLNQTDAFAFPLSRHYLEEIGVKKIDNLQIAVQIVGEFPRRQELFSFIKDFHVKNVWSERGLPEDVLRSLLQSNLSLFSYNGPVQAEFLLQAYSPIPRLEFENMQMTSDEFKEILWKINSGALRSLILPRNHLPWDSFTSVRLDHEGPLPDERPLLIHDDYGYFEVFLHSDGGITLCSRDYKRDTVEICKQNDSNPAFLLAEEEVHKVLAEKGSVHCLRSHYMSFFNRFPIFDESYDGPLPEDRPLVFAVIRGSVSHYLLRENESIEVYNWYCEGEYMESHSLDNLADIDFPPPLGLQKYMLKRFIEKRFTQRWFFCGKAEYLHDELSGFKTLPYDFRGQLPEDRPLVFENIRDQEDTLDTKHRIVLWEDGSLTLYRAGYRFVHHVEIEPCPAWNLPLCMMTTEKLREIVQDAPLEKFTYNLDFEEFCEAFDGIKTLPFEDRPLIFEKTQQDDNNLLDERWLLLKDGNVRKCEWENGRATFSKGDPLKFPSVLVKILVRDFFKGKEVDTSFDFFIDRGVLNECLKNCEIYSYDYAGPVSHKRPLIFEKTEEEKVCSPNSASENYREVLHLCFVSEDEEVIHTTWRAGFLSFIEEPAPRDLPPVLKTKEMLEHLLNVAWSSDEREIKWYGSDVDFIACFEGYKTLDFDYEGRLPRSRPLVFKERSRNGRVGDHFLLRKDGLMIMCEYSNVGSTFTMNPDSCPNVLASSS